jgi:ribosomal protein S18 acetylase RimI-like enzyme
MVNLSKLDNPVWYSLMERHQAVAINYINAKFYHPDYCPFGAFEASDHLSNGWIDYASLTDNFFIVGEKPTFPASLAIKREVVCLQMVLEKQPQVEIKENIALLDSKHEDALFELVNLVQPGYFKRKTSQLGNYYGIFKDDKLVAVSGERMKLNGLVEISAIVTHPNYTSKGYAKQLITHTVNKIVERNCLPFLHVVQSNTSAIGLYNRLGFATRRTISFWNIVRVNGDH